jgi:hypothetical protein
VSRNARIRRSVQRLRLVRLLLLTLRNLLCGGGAVLLLVRGGSLCLFLRRVLMCGLRRFITHGPKTKAQVKRRQSRRRGISDVGAFSFSSEERLSGVIFRGLPSQALRPRLRSTHQTFSFSRRWPKKAGIHLILGYWKKTSYWLPYREAFAVPRGCRHEVFDRQRKGVDNFSKNSLSDCNCRLETLPPVGDLRLELFV